MLSPSLYDGTDLNRITMCGMDVQRDAPTQSQQVRAPSLQQHTIALPLRDELQPFPPPPSDHLSHPRLIDHLSDPPHQLVVVLRNKVR